MEQIISKEEFAEIKKAKGEVRGIGPRAIAEYVLRKEGEHGLKKLEDVMRSLDFPIEYRKINQMDYYPYWLVTASFLAVKRLFNFVNEDFQKMGALDVKFTPLQKFFIKYFVSLKKMAESASKMWEHYDTVGKIELIEFDEKNKRAVMKVTEFDRSEYQCQYLIGYIAAMAKIVSKTMPVCEETKCTFRGDEYHEFTLTW
jgi:hypothetical protein